MDARTEAQPLAPADAGQTPPPGGRHDLYAGIHKALRLFMMRALEGVGSADQAKLCRALGLASAPGRVAA